MAAKAAIFVIDLGILPKWNNHKTLERWKNLQTFVTKKVNGNIEFLFPFYFVHYRPQKITNDIASLWQKPL
jgi:hypothetical protein